jgi:quinol monooxygenase YgiN
MPYVSIRHKVADYAKWKRAIHAACAFRKTAGEKSFQVYRDRKSPNDLTVVCSWENGGKMQKFIKSPQLRKAMKEAGVVGKPAVQFFSKVEDLTVN